MLGDLPALLEELESRIAAVGDLKTLEDTRVALIGRKGRVTELAKSLGKLDPSERPAAGQAINEFKRTVEARLQARRDELAEAELEARLAAERVDITLPVRERPVGRIHPVSQVTDEIIAIFADMGFSVAEGPDVEDDFHNFTALNFPPEHPAR
ncbi:MAG: phenylalanine--tRNA ligase subunit alpha, partial [Geminicoccaceae bacterium]|nr:phenylalanine--tRNA ligase subunit alpha [Geminicoccaceae bacterium]